MFIEDMPSEFIRALEILFVYILLTKALFARKVLMLAVAELMFIVLIVYEEIEDVLNVIVERSAQNNSCNTGIRTILSVINLHI